MCKVSLAFNFFKLYFFCLFKFHQPVLRPYSGFCSLGSFLTGSGSHVGKMHGLKPENLIHPLSRKVPYLLYYFISPLYFLLKEAFTDSYNAGSGIVSFL